MQFIGASVVSGKSIQEEREDTMLIKLKLIKPKLALVKEYQKTKGDGKICDLANTEKTCKFHGVEINQC